MKIFILSNRFGDVIHITNYGARLVKWLTQVSGESRNIILGYDKVEKYLTDDWSGNISDIISGDILFTTLYSSIARVWMFLS